jgi:hypothetical protein
MASFILSTVLLFAVVGGLGGWMIRKDRRLREADAGDEPTRLHLTPTRKEPDAGHHRQRA